MSKGFKKFITACVVIGGACAGAYYYFTQKNLEDELDDFDDFDDLDDFDMDDDGNRSYVSLTPASDAEKEDTKVSPDSIPEATTETIEEFFDEEEDSEEDK